MGEFDLNSCTVYRWVGARWKLGDPPLFYIDEFLYLFSRCCGTGVYRMYNGVIQRNKDRCFILQQHHSPIASMSEFKCQ